MNEISNETKETNVNITIFSSDVFGDIRVSGTPEEPMFCLGDVCKKLDLTTTKVSQRLEDGVLSRYPIIDSMGRVQNALFVNEDGLYDVILDSRKPEAKAFRKWITSEVLPQIRKTGGYVPVSQNDTEESLKVKMEIVYENTLNEMAKRFGGVIEKVAVENKQLREANTVLAEDNQAKSQELAYTKSELNQQISDNCRLRSNNKFHEKVNENLREENRIYKGLYDKYMNTEGWFTATEVASEIGVSPQKLNAWLNKNGWIKKGSHDWLPTVDFIELNKKYDGGLYKIFPVVYSYGGKDYTRQQLRYSRYFKDLLVERYRKNKQQAV